MALNASTSIGQHKLGNFSHSPLMMLSEARRVPNDQDDNLIELIDTLEQINTEQVSSKLNEISISDNNGSRIFF